MKELASDTFTGASLRSQIVEIARAEWEKWGRGTKSETDAGMKNSLRSYWMSVEGSEAKVRTHIASAHAWSAVFISFVMRKAGAGEAFKYSTYHSTFIAVAKQAASQQDEPNFGRMISGLLNPKLEIWCAVTER